MGTSSSTATPTTITIITSIAMTRLITTAIWTGVTT